MQGALTLHEQVCNLGCSPGAQAVAGTKKLAYDEVKWVDPEDFRHLCDRCATSIPDMHRTCAVCDRRGDGYDLCLHCCAEVRAAGQVLPWCPAQSYPGMSILATWA